MHVTSVQSKPAGTKRILVVEDDALLRRSLAVALAREGFEVLEAADGHAALAALELNNVDLVVLDVMLPGLDGFEVCWRVRRASEVPIFVLSARGDEVDRVVALELGADGYLTKPFSLRELLARLHALLRRADVPPGPDTVIHIGDLRIDPSQRSVYRGNTPLPLRPREFALLAYLARHPGRAFSREELLAAVWGFAHPGADARTVDMHIHRLRRKIEADPAHPRHLVTVSRVGYRFQP